MFNSKTDVFMRVVRLLTLVALFSALLLGFASCKKVTERKIVGQWETETNIVGGMQMPGLRGITAGTYTFKKGGEYLYENELSHVPIKGKWELSGSQLKISILNELTKKYDEPTVYTVTVLKKKRIKLLDKSDTGMILKRK